MTPDPATNPSTDTKTSLLDAAESLFSERGFAGVSTREIVERAGANIAAIKYHFGSKEGLYRAVLRRAMDRPESDELWECLPEAGSELGPGQAAAGIASFITAFFRHVVDEAASDTAPSLLCREAFEPSEAFDELVSGYIQPRMERLEHSIGVLRPSADSDELRAVGQGIMGMVLQYKTFFEIQARMWLGHAPEAARVSKIAAVLASFALRGLGCDDEQVREALEQTRETIG